MSSTCPQQPPRSFSLVGLGRVLDHSFFLCLSLAPLLGLFHHLRPLPSNQQFVAPWALVGMGGEVGLLVLLIYLAITVVMCMVVPLAVADSATGVL